MYHNSAIKCPCFLLKEIVFFLIWCDWQRGPFDIRHLVIILFMIWDNCNNNIQKLVLLSLGESFSILWSIFPLCLSVGFVIFWDRASVALNSLCRPGWLWTHDPPVSASWVIRLRQACATMPVMSIRTSLNNSLVLMCYSSLWSYQYTLAFNNVVKQYDFTR